MVRLGALGDMVMFLPVIAAAHQRWGGRFDIVSEGSWAPEILACSPHVNQVHLLKGTNRRPLWLSTSKRRCARFLKQRSVLLFEKYHKLDDVLDAAGVSPDRRAEACDLERADNEHQIDLHLRLLCQVWPDEFATLPLDNVDAVPVIEPHQQALQDAREWLLERGLTGRQLILIQPGNKRTMRRGSLTRASNSKFWPVQRWAELVDAMCEETSNATALICGVPREQALAEEIARNCASGNALAIADQLPVSRLIALSRMAHSMVSVDTGPAHVAAAVGCPLVVMFGKADPRVYSPRGNGRVTVLTPWNNPRSGPNAFCEMIRHPMLMLTTKKVLQAWRDQNTDKAERPRLHAVDSTDVRSV